MSETKRKGPCIRAATGLGEMRLQMELGPGACIRASDEVQGRRPDRVQSETSMRAVRVYQNIMGIVDNLRTTLKFS